jgi:hypothetical protein
MPQVKILGMYLVSWQLFLLLTITPGVECAFDLFYRHDEVFTWVLDQLQSRSLVIYKAWEGSRCFHQDLSTCSEMYNGIKVNIQKLFQILFPTHQESLILKTRTRRYGKNTEHCAVWNQPLTDCIAGVIYAQLSSSEPVSCVWWLVEKIISWTSTWRGVSVHILFRK